MRDIVAVHTSDVHIDSGHVPDAYAGNPTGGLEAVLALAQKLSADVVLLAGDTFESLRQPPDVIERTAAVLRTVSLPVVMLPGNHDPALPDAVYRRAVLAGVRNLHVFGVTQDNVIALPELALEICGRAHRDYSDMPPFEGLPPRQARRRIVMAHGHYEAAPDYGFGPRPSWLFGDAEMTASDADYIALGHWNRAAKVGTSAPAYYSGSPDYTRAVNVVRFGDDAVTVTREPLKFPA